MRLDKLAFGQSARVKAHDPNVVNTQAQVVLAAPGAKKRWHVHAYGFSVGTVAVPAGGADVTLALTTDDDGAQTIHHRLPPAAVAPMAFMHGERGMLTSENTAVTLTVPALAGVNGACWIAAQIVDA